MNLLQCSKTKYNRLKTHLRFTTLYHHHLSRLLSFSACFILISTKVHSTKMIRCTLDLIYFTIRIVNQIVLSFQYFASVRKSQQKNIYCRVNKFNYVSPSTGTIYWADNAALQNDKNGGRRGSTRLVCDWLWTIHRQIQPNQSVSSAAEQQTNPLLLK